MRSGIEACNEKGVYISSEETAVVTDLHLGVRDPDSVYPKMEYDSINSQIQNIIQEYRPERLIFNGDTFANKTIDQRSIEMFKTYQEKVGDLVFINGNHEARNGGYPDKIRTKYKIRQNIQIGDFFIHHGHRTPPKKAKCHIIGHLHPMHNGKDVLLYKKNSYYNSDVIVSPKMSSFVSGSDFRQINPRGHCPLAADGDSLETYQVVRSY